MLNGLARSLNSFGNQFWNWVRNTKVEAGQLPEGDVKKVPAAARWVKNAEIHQLPSERKQFARSSGGIYSLAPWGDDGWTYYALYVGFGGEVSAKGMTLFRVHAVLKERAEDCGIYFRPILRRGTIRSADQFQFGTA